MNNNPFLSRNPNMDSMEKIDLTKVSDSYPSLCIPRVFRQVTEEKVKSVIDELNFGLIHKVEIIDKQNMKEEKYKCVFIHFKKWNVNETINNIREKILLGKEIKVMYDEPWFWKIYMYRPNTKNFNFNRQEQKKSEEIKTKLWSIRTPSNSPPRRRNILKEDINNQEKQNNEKQNDEKYDNQKNT
jgi:hypothetical protein